MSDLAGSRVFVQTESVKTRKPVSENVLQTIGGALNFQTSTNIFQHTWKVNGQYAGYANLLGVDNAFIIPVNAQIFQVRFFIETPGASGTTEMDIKYASTSGGSFTSIFTTTPKAISTTPAFSYIEIGGTVTGMTAPVLTTNPFLVVKGGILRADLIQSMGSMPYNVSVTIDYYAR